MNVVEGSKNHSFPFLKTTITAGSLLCLLASWALLFVYMLLMTDTELNPWDAAPASALPPAGTLSHVLHDLFTTFPTIFLPALVVLGVSVGLFLRQFIPTKKLVPLALRFALTNIAFVGVSALANPLVWGLERRLLEALGIPFDYGFYRHYVSMLFLLLLLLVLFGLQLSPALRRGPGKAGKSPIDNWQGV